MLRFACAAIALLAVFAGIAVAETPESPEQKGLRIAREADAAGSGFKGSQGEMQMQLINAHGDEIQRRMSFRSKEIDDDGDRSLIEFAWPADVKGTRMLTWSHKKGQDDQWLYLPSLKRVKRISTRSRTGSFMGSEFSYEDLGSQEVEKYTYKYLKEEVLDGRKAHVMERYPTEEKSGYSKQVVWQDQEYQGAIKIDFYDRKGELLKTMTLGEYKKLDRWWRVHRIEVFNHQTKKKSILSWKGQKLGVEFDEDDFDSENLDEG